MELHEETNTAIDKLYVEWYISLEACLGQLQHIDSLTRQLQVEVQALHVQNEMRSLRNRILLQKNMLSAIIEEVQHARSRYNSNDKKEITMANLLENNRLREKVRKAEQSSFMLRYQVNQLLSKAS